MVNIKVHERRHKTQILTHWEDQQLHNTAKLLCFSAVSQIMSLKGQSDTTMVISRVILVRYAQPWFMNIIFGVITLCTRKAPWMEFMTQHGEFSRNFFFAYRLPCLSKPLKNLRKCNTWQFWCFFHCTEGRSRWTIPCCMQQLFISARLAHGHSEHHQVRVTTMNTWDRNKSSSPPR